MTVNARIAKLPRTNAPTFASVVTLCLLSLQVFFEVGCYCRRFRYLVRNTIEELSDAGILAGSNLVLGPDRAERTLVEHRDAIGDPESACEFMGHDDHSH